MVGNPFLFTGKEYDSETALYYFRARYYSVKLGRFLSRDPVYGGNLYAYVQNNCISKVDPWGLKPGDKYSTQDEAANDAVNDIVSTSVRQDREYAGWIYRNSDATYSYTPARPGSAHSSDPGFKPPGGTAYYHTHGAESGPRYDDEHFSPNDISYGRGHGVDGYLGTPSGEKLKYDDPGGEIGPIDDTAKGGSDGPLNEQPTKGKDTTL